MQHVSIQAGTRADLTQSRRRPATRNASAILAGLLADADTQAHAQRRDGTGTTIHGANQDMSQMLRQISLASPLGPAKALAFGLS